MGGTADVYAMELEYYSDLYCPVNRRGIPWTRWISSILLHLAALVCLVFLPAAAVHERFSAPPVLSVSLIAPRLPEPVRRNIVKEISHPLPRPVQVRPPMVTPPPVVHRHVEIAKFQAPQVDLPVPVNPAITLPVPDPPSPRRDVFAAAAPVQTAPAPVRAVQVGGFGDPNGVHNAATPRSGFAMAKAGAFDLPAGEGRGGGHAGVLVANAGFGGWDSGNGGGGSGNGRGGVRTAGFGEYETAPSARIPARAASPTDTPVEITFKPKPAYTSEARTKRLEGEVLFEVIFRATGGLDILRLTRGLGSGLDETARAAATQIRFRPATRDGVPVDIKGIVHIVFELS